jgi:phosphatidylinositol 3-kinase
MSTNNTGDSIGNNAERLNTRHDDMRPLVTSEQDKKNKSMSFSVYVDSKDHMKGHRRKIKRWVEDNAVANCQKCNTEFDAWWGLWNRRHHCRICGKVFCWVCTNNWLIIPNEMIPDLPKTSNYSVKVNEEVRVCDNCKVTVDEFNKFYKYVRSRVCDFDLIRLRQILPSEKMHTIEECGEESDDYSYIKYTKDSKYISSHKSPYIDTSKLNAAMYCINKLKEIQYKLPIERFSKLEKDLLWSNRHYFCGHSKWIVQILKIVDYTDHVQVTELQKLLAEPKKNKCWDTMCTRYCSQEIELSGLMDILHAGLNHPIVNALIKKCIDKSDRDEIMLFLPFIAFYINKNEFLFETLMSKFQYDNNFMCEFYLCVRMYNTSESFIDMFDTMVSVLPVSDTLNKLYTLKNYDKNKEYRDIVTPIEPDQVYDRIDIEKIKQYDSASKPILLPCVRKDGTIKNILLKNEDVRKDHIVSNLINLACKKLMESKTIDIDIITYKVSPLTKNSGLIEIVDDAKTIFDITETHGFTVQNYINEYNSHLVSGEITEKFMKSAAIYCVIAYLLGFGDRHLDNIMISKSGLLFHIDFGFILGCDPKLGTSKRIKYSPEMINVMGGYKSKNYVQFKKYCADIYNQLRLHINSFMNMLLILSTIDPSLSNEYIKEELLSRFEVGESSLEAEIHLKTKIDIGGYTAIDKLLDVMYKSKNSELVKGIRYISELPGIVKSLVSS